MSDFSFQDEVDSLTRDLGCGSECRERCQSRKRIVEFVSINDFPSSRINHTFARQTVHGPKTNVFVRLQPKSRPIAHKLVQMAETLNKGDHWMRFPKHLNFARRSCPPAQIYPSLIVFRR